MTAPAMSDRLEKLLNRLKAAESATVDAFPPLPGFQRRPGSVESMAHFFDHFGLFFEEERLGSRVFTTVHALAGKSPEESARTLETIAASAKTSGLCYNPSCPLRAEGTFKELALCSACRSAGYCGVPCQREHRPLHKAACKRIAAGIAAADLPPGAGSVELAGGAEAFSRAATAATVGASGPIAILSWIWRSKTGYGGEIPKAGLLPPVVLIELADSNATGWRQPIPLRISELTDPLGCEPGSAWLGAMNFPEFFVRLVMEEDGRGYGTQVRSGERVLCVVTTPSRNPRRTKWMTLVHSVPLPVLSRKLKRIERAVDSDGEDSMYAMQVLEARAIVARPVFGDEASLLFNDRRAEDDIATDHKADLAFCNLQYAVDFDVRTPLAPVHALLMSDCELFSRRSAQAR